MPASAGGPKRAPGGSHGQDKPPAGEPGVRESFARVRAAVTRLLDAHLSLLRAELAVAGRELGIIVGLAAAALVVALLTGILLYVGGFLFFGEVLFGSMGWGLIHGTLLAALVIAVVGVNLAGGDTRRFALGGLVGLGVGVVLAVLLLSNVGNTGGEALGDWLEREFQTDQLPFGPAWLVTLAGLVVGALVGLVAALIVGWRSGLRGSRLGAPAMAGLLAGGLIGAIWSSTRYDAPDGVLGLAITVGMLGWLIAGALLAARRGFDPETRYANLVPRESMAAFDKTKAFLLAQWERQKDRMMGR